METIAHAPVARFDVFAPLGSLYLSRLVRSPRGRAFMLSFMVQSEEADEAGVFDTLLARVDDPELKKLVRVHRDDEARHAGMLRACLARNGFEVETIPSELRVVERIDRHAGGLAEEFLGGRSGVMEAYLLLQVIEERGVRQFPLIAAAMRPYDPESADTIDRICRDEERHVKYAKAISRRYAPDEATLERELLRYRRAEARAFAEHTQALLSYTTKRGLGDGGGSTARYFWRAVAKLGELSARFAVS